MTLKDVLLNAKNLIENSTNYKVVFHPQEITRKDEILIDVSGIDIHDRFTGGYTLEVRLEVSFVRTSRLDALEIEETIIKVLNEPTYLFVGAEHDIDGDMIICNMSFIGREVVYYG